MIEKKLQQIQNVGGGAVTLYPLAHGWVKATTFHEHGMLTTEGKSAADAIDRLHEQLAKLQESGKKSHGR